jgi:hypothetical protein
LQGALPVRGRAGQPQEKGAKNGMHIDNRGVAGVDEASPGIDILEKASGAHRVPDGL